MAYVSAILTSGEIVEHRGAVSWVNYIPGLLLLLLFPPLGIALLIAQWLRQATTEIVVTDRRLIYKTGIISRRAIDVERARIETVALEQSIAGRLLGFGTVIVRGAGVGEIVIETVDSPVALRKVLMR